MRGRVPGCASRTELTLSGEASASPLTVQGGRGKRRAVIADLGRARARRLVGLGIACLLSWQAVGILPAISRTHACCCARMQAEKRRCPVCAHSKEIES